MTTPWNTTAAEVAGIPSGGTSVQAYQFKPESQSSFKGYAKFGSDATIAGGALSTVNSASGVFSAAQPGMVILIEAAGSTFAGSGTASALRATISTVVSANQVTISTPASGAVTSRTVAYGWDSTAAVNAAISAGAAYATANYYYFELLVSGWYLIDGALIQGGATKGNAQIPLPVVGITGNPAMTMAVVGTRNNSGPIMFQGSGDTPAAGWNGVGFLSTLVGQVYSGTFGQPALMGGPTFEQGYTGGFTNLWNNLVVVIDGVTFMIPPVTSVTGLDLTACTQAEWPRVRALPMAPASVLGAAGYNPVWSGGQAFPKGLVAPQGGNNAHVFAGSVTAYGFATGVESYEQFECQELATIFNGSGLFANGAVGGHNAVTILKWSAEANNTHLLVNSAARTGINIVSMQAENASQYTAGVFINDASNQASGRIGINSSLNTASITVTGGANLEIIGDYTSNGISRGLQTPPGVPATTVALVNPFSKHNTVYIATGAGVTVSVIAINGTTTGLTMAASSTTAVRVPTGASITLTYAGGTPSWNWFSD